MRHFSLALLLLFVFSGLAFAQETSPASQEQQLSLKFLPYAEPVETIGLEDGKKIYIRCSTLADDLSDASRLYYETIPNIRIDKSKLYDSKTSRLTFDIEVPVYDNIIRQKLTQERLRNLPLVQLPIRGYEILISADGAVQKIKEEKVITEGHIQISGGITCSVIVDNPVIKQALENSPETVGITVVFYYRFKNSLGSEMSAKYQRLLTQKIEENIFGNANFKRDKDTVLISRSTLKECVRNVETETSTAFTAYVHVNVTGNVDAVTTNWIESFLNQNLFREKTLSEYENILDSLLFYTPHFAFEELQPDYVNELKNSHEVRNVAKKHFLEEINKYKELAETSENVNEFESKTKQKGSSSGSFGVDIIKVISFGGSGDFNYEGDSDVNKYNRTWEDVYQKLRDKSFNAEDLFNSYYEKITGEMKLFYSSPKDYKVMRLNRSQIEDGIQFYFQKSTVVSNFSPIVYQTSIGKIVTQDKIKELEAVIRERDKSIEILKNEILKLAHP